MGSGKSTVARAIAERAGTPSFDLDRVIEQRVGKSVAEVFAQRGEAAFRQLEASVLRELIAAHHEAVFALGGGSVLNAELRREMLAAGVLVTLRAPISELARRVGSGDGRPLLAGQDVAGKLRTLLDERAAAYAECHAVVETEGRTPAALCDAIVALAADRPIVVPLGTRTYRVEVGPGVRHRAAARIAAVVKSERVVLVSDTNVAPLWAESVAAPLRAAGRQVTSVVLPAGEEHKTLRTVEQIWEAALDAGLDRSGAVLALGGGVVGDMAGFAASTVLRGVPVGHLPTTLLAMVDSAVGGKTGFDTRHGKNLIGTFHQPSFVLCDPEFLGTLPDVERRAGLAEVAKSAWIEGEGQVAELERDRGGLLAGEPAATLRAIVMSAVMKARVVSEDERESNVRALLNLGHTVGHAIEASQGYAGMRHGEAVALGMVAALKLSQRLGHAQHSDVQRGIELLRGLGLPVDVGPYLRQEVLSFIASDKKRSSDRITFVLPGRPGNLKLHAMLLPELLALLAKLEA